MDRQSLALMIPILALSIPIVAIIVTGMVKVHKARLDSQTDHPALLAEMDELRQDLHQVRAELAEVQERLDFTERLLTAPDRQRTPEG